MFQKALKYLGIAAVCISIAVPSLMHFSMYHWQSLKIRQEVKAKFKEGLSADEIQHFSFNKNQYEALNREGEDEFIWQGHKYDIIKITRQGGKIFIEAWLDDAESALRHRFHDMLDRQLPRSTDSEINLLDFFKSFHLLPFKEMAHQEENPPLFSKYLDLKGKLSLQSLSPPPDEA